MPSYGGAPNMLRLSKGEPTLDEFKKELVARLSLGPENTEFAPPVEAVETDRHDPGLCSGIFCLYVGHQRHV